MAASKVLRSAPMVGRARAERANAWITKWQVLAPKLLTMTLSNELLSVHSVPTRAAIYMLDWSSDCAMVYDLEGSEEPYRLRDEQSALVFLDALLMHYVSRLSQSAGCVEATLARPVQSVVVSPDRVA